MQIIHSYVHHDGSIGVLAAFHCDTDFAARTKEFKEFMQNVCMSLVSNYDWIYSEDHEFFELGMMEMAHDSCLLQDYEDEMCAKFKEQIYLDDFKFLKACKD